MYTTIAFLKLKPLHCINPAISWKQQAIYVNTNCKLSCLP